MSDTGMGPDRKLSSERAHELVERYAIVKSTHKLAAEFGVAPITVSRTLQRMGITVGRNGRSLSEEEKILVVNMDKDGKSIVFLARHFGVSKKSIANVLHPDRQKEPAARSDLLCFTTEQEKEIVERYAAWETTLDLAACFKVNSCTINKTLRRCGVTPRKKIKNRTKEESKILQDIRMSIPKKRLRSILMARRATAEERGFIFDDALFKIIPNNPPTHCACCGVEIDYSSTRKRGAKLAPSIDRVDNERGYTADNVAITCVRCNRLKSDATLVDLKMLLAYVEKYVLAGKE